MTGSGLVPALLHLLKAEVQEVTLKPEPVRDILGYMLSSPLEPTCRLQGNGTKGDFESGLSRHAWKEVNQNGSYIYLQE